MKEKKERERERKKSPAGAEGTGRARRRSKEREGEGEGSPWRRLGKRRSKKDAKRKIVTWIEAELSSLECFEIPIDPRSYLEVIDRKNRYGKNLRLYYKEYQNCVSNQKSNCCSRLLREANNNSEEMSCGDKKYKEFFEWLEYDDGNHEVEGCTRELLDTETVFYCQNFAEAERYKVIIDPDTNLMVWASTHAPLTTISSPEYNENISCAHRINSEGNAKKENDCPDDVSHIDRLSLDDIPVENNISDNPEVSLSDLKINLLPSSVMEEKISKIMRNTSLSALMDVSAVNLASATAECGVATLSNSTANSCQVLPNGSRCRQDYVILNPKNRKSTVDLEACENLGDDEKVGVNVLDTESESDSDSESESEDMETDIEQDEERSRRLSTDSIRSNQNTEQPEPEGRMGDQGETDIDGPDAVVSLEPLDTETNDVNTLEVLERWIFVVKNNKFYVHPKVTKSFPRFHHSSFFGGAPVDAAGLFSVRQGVIEELHLHSGHYRPTEIHLYRLLLMLLHKTSSRMLSTMQVDAQRIMHIARMVNADGSKMKKLLTTSLWPASKMLDFLTCKKHMWASGVFKQVHEARVQGIAAPKIIPDEAAVVKSPEKAPVSIVLSRSTSGPMSPLTFAAYFNDNQGWDSF